MNEEPQDTVLPPRRGWEEMCLDSPSQKSTTATSMCAIDRPGNQDRAMYSTIIGGVFGPSAVASWHSDLVLPFHINGTPEVLVSGPRVLLDVEALGLVPRGWRQVTATVGGSWRESFTPMSWVGHSCWSCLGAVLLVVPLVIWKVFVVSVDSERDVAQSIDAVISLGTVFTFLQLSLEHSFPGEDPVTARCLLAVLWLAFAVVHLCILLFTTQPAYCKQTAVVAFAFVAAAIFCLGIVCYWKMRSGNVLLFFFLPCLFVGCVHIVVLTCCLPFLESRVSLTIFGGRSGLSLVAVVPLVTLHICLRNLHVVTPKRVRTVFGVEFMFYIPQKLLTYSLPPYYAFAAEVVHQLIRSGIMSFLPVIQDFVWQKQDELQLHQFRLYTSQAVFASIQCELCSVFFCAVLILSLRYKQGRDLSVYETVLMFLVTGLLASLSSVFVGARLHKKGIPVSGVYWMYGKWEHLRFVSTALLAGTAAAVTPQLLDSIDAIDRSLQI